MKPELKKWVADPLRVFLALIVIIVIVESLTMYSLSMINGLVSPTVLIFLDSLLLVLILSPALHFFVVFPLFEQIRERSAAENALRESEARYRHLIDSVEGIVWEADPQSFAFTFVSGKAEDILGYPVAAWLEEPTFWADHLNPDDRDWAIDFCVSSSRDLRNHAFEYRMFAADGRVVWLRDLVTVVVEAGEAVSLRGLMVDITDRKNTELALAASERRYQFMADNLHDVIWKINADLCYSYVSGSVEAMFGYRGDELIGHPFNVVLTESSAQKAEEILLAAEQGRLAGTEGQYTLNQEFECLRKDGTMFWAEVSATLLYSSDQKLQTILGSSRDITDRKHAEIERKTTHDLLQKTISSLNEAVIIVDSTTREIKDLNRAAEQMFSYTREELMGADISMLHVCSEMYERFSADMLNAITEQGSFTTKLRMKKKSGWVFTAEQSVAPVIADGGNWHHYVYVVRDISGQIKHEEDLNRAYAIVAERNAFVESVITNIQSGIVVLDQALRITMINPYAANLCRRDLDELTGMSLQEICPELYEQVVNDHVPDEIIVSFCGKRFIIGYGCFKMHNVRGDVTGIILTFRDLTEIIKIRNEIRQKQRLSDMGEVVARVAHEMRNPLFGMTAAGQILSMELNLNSAQQLLMDSLLKESRRLNNLVDELLDSTREVRLHKKNINLITVVNDSLRLVEGDAAERDVTLTYGQISGEIQVNGDPDKLEQVLLNLLRNGIEACTAGGKVDMSVSVEGTMALITVADNGSGISEDVMDAIFDVFYTTKKNGTGMGLSISRNIIEAHSGELYAYNNAGAGATFVVKLPVQVMDR